MELEYLFCEFRAQRSAWLGGGYGGASTCSRMGCLRSVNPYSTQREGAPEEEERGWECLVANVCISGYGWLQTPLSLANTDVWSFCCHVVHWKDGAVQVG